MTFLWPARAAVLGASLVVLACAGATGLAHAQPDLSPLVNTTCSYSQVVSALNAQAPDLAKQLSEYPMVQSRIQAFLADSVDQRQQLLDKAINAHPKWQANLNQKVGDQQGQQFENAVIQVANTCSTY